MSSALGIALLGAGTVGAAVAHGLVGRADRLAARSGGPLALRCVAERDPQRLAGLPLDGVAVLPDAAAALEVPGVEIAVEVLGGMEPAGSLLTEALRRGMGVVTANKAVLATRGRSLAAMVRPGSGGLAFEAAVGAAIPVLGALRDALGGVEVHCVRAVINGTTNDVLGRLEAGESFAEAVAAAQSSGFAEADPSADIDGHDAAQKLCILAWLGLGAEVVPDQVERRGIRGIDRADTEAAAALGCAIRLVARAERLEDGLALSVQPTLLPRAHPLARCRGAENLVVLWTDVAGPIALGGLGAGAGPAASAVLGDIVQVARARREGRALTLPAAAPVHVLDSEEVETAAWVRLRAGEDRETPAIVAQMLEDRGVAVESVGAAPGSPDLLVSTAPAPRAVLRRALETLDTVPVVGSVEQVLDRLELPQ
jgi:homoserine dehydrogenase